MPFKFYGDIEAFPLGHSNESEIDETKSNKLGEAGCSNLSQ